MYCMWIYDYFITFGDEVCCSIEALHYSDQFVGDVWMVREKNLGWVYPVPRLGI